MNIDLRNISEDFEENVKRVKLQYAFNTNSKAVEHCTVNYLKKLKEIEDLKRQLSETKDELTTYKMNLYSLRDLLKWVNKL